MSTKIPPLAQVFLCGILGWTATKGFPEFAFVSTASRLLGWSFVSIGSVVLLLSIRSFIIAKTTVNPISIEKVNELVTTGLYRYSRNPMYAGMASLLTGLALALQNPAALISPALFVLSVTYLQILPEERTLEEKFGHSFKAYCKGTRRWF